MCRGVSGRWFNCKSSPGTESGAMFQTARFPIRAGRSPECDLALDDAGVWPRHFQIDWQREGLILEVEPDALLSLNDSPVRRAVLRNGDVHHAGSGENPLQPQPGAPVLAGGARGADVDCVGRALPGPGGAGLCPAPLNSPRRGLTAFQCRKWRDAGERHRHALLVGGCNDFGVANASRRVEWRRSRPALAAAIKPSGKGKKRRCKRRCRPVKAPPPAPSKWRSGLRPRGSSGPRQSPACGRRRQRRWHST